MLLSEHKIKLDEAKAEKLLLEKNIKSAYEGLSCFQEKVEDLERAREIVNEVLCLTQSQVKGFIEEVVSLALSTVHGEEFEFEIEYNIKRNQSEVYFWIVEDGERLSPDFDSGGGVKDTCAFALRIALHALMNPKTAPLFLLDEPAKHLSNDKQEAFGSMLREVSNLLGIQIITISQSKECTVEADIVYKVVKENGVSKVEERHE